MLWWCFFHLCLESTLPHNNKESPIGLNVTTLPLSHIWYMNYSTLRFWFGFGAELHMRFARQNSVAGKWIMPSPRFKDLFYSTAQWSRSSLHPSTLTAMPPLLHLQVNIYELKRDSHVKTIYFIVRTCIFITIWRTWSYSPPRSSLMQFQSCAGGTQLRSSELVY